MLSKRRQPTPETGSMIVPGYWETESMTSSGIQEKELISGPRLQLWKCHVPITGCPQTCPSQSLPKNQSDILHFWLPSTSSLPLLFILLLSKSLMGTVPDSYFPPSFHHPGYFKSHCPHPCPATMAVFEMSPCSYFAFSNLFFTLRSVTSIQIWSISFQLQNHQWGPER